MRKVIEVRLRVTEVFLEEMIIELKKLLGASQRKMGRMMCRQMAGSFDDVMHEGD